MSTGKMQFLKKYGNDPAVKYYVSERIHIDLGIYSEMFYYTKNKKIIYWMLFPYVFNGTNYIWTDDKLTFNKFEQLKNFSKELDFKLERSKNVKICI